MSGLSAARRALDGNTCAFSRTIQGKVRLRRRRDWAISYDDLEAVLLHGGSRAGSAGDQDYDLRVVNLSMRRWSCPTSKKRRWTSSTPTIRIPGHVTARRAQQPPLRWAPTCCGNNNCSPICPSARCITALCISRRRSAPGQGHFKCCRLPDRSGADKKVAAILYRDPKGGEHRVEEDICSSAHSIETPTHADVDEQRLSDGVATVRHVGRNLMTPQTSISSILRSFMAGRGPEQSSSLSLSRRPLPGDANSEEIQS